MKQVYRLGFITFIYGKKGLNLKTDLGVEHLQENMEQVSCHSFHTIFKTIINAEMSIIVVLAYRVLGMPLKIFYPFDNRLTSQPYT